MTVPSVLILVALIFAVFEEFKAQGRSMLAWAVVLISVALLWNVLQ